MIYGIILAGGKGSRLNNTLPKQLLPLGNKTVLEWSLSCFNNNINIDGIIIISEVNLIETIKSIVDNGNYSKVVNVVKGGTERFESSSIALSSMDFDDSDILLFHDAARPFITSSIINDMISCLNSHDAAGTYISSVDTMAESRDGIVFNVPDRNNLFAAQTPQGFKYEIIKAAHENVASSDLKPTDDISLVMSLGVDVMVIPGVPQNFKITTAHDYTIAKLLVDNNEIS